MVRLDSVLHNAGGTKEEAFAKLANGDGTYIDGTYMIEKHSSPEVYVLSVVYRGKPTRHKVAKNNDGVLCVNNKQYGNDNGIDLEGLLNLLAGNPPPKGWPVRLSNPVLVDTASSVEESGDSATRKSGFLADILHSTAMPKEQVFDKLADPNGSYSDGTYMLEQHTVPDVFVLSVVYRGKPTRHKIAKKDGVLCVNGKQYGNDANIDLEGLVRLLSSDTLPKGWPVKLARAIPVNDTTTTSGPSEVAPVLPLRVETQNDSNPTTGQASVRDHVGFLATVLHPEGGTKEEAFARLANSDGTYSDGNYMLEKHASPGIYVLSVVYRGKPTRHKVAKKDGILCINNKQYGDDANIDLESLIKLLSRDQLPKGWPVRLAEPVLVDQVSEVEQELPPVPYMQVEAQANPEPDPEQEPERQVALPPQNDGGDDDDGVFVDTVPRLSADYDSDRDSLPPLPTLSPNRTLKPGERKTSIELRDMFDQGLELDLEPGTQIIDPFDDEIKGREDTFAGKLRSKIEEIEARMAAERQAAIDNMGATLLKILQTLDVHNPSERLTPEEMNERWPVDRIREELAAVLEQVTLLKDPDQEISSAYIADVLENEADENGELSSADIIAGVISALDDIANGKMIRFHVPRQSYANLVDLKDDDLMVTQAGYCGQLDSATVKAIVSDAEDRDFVIFKAGGYRFRLCYKEVSDYYGDVTVRDVERSDDRVFWESAQQFEHIEDLIRFFAEVGATKTDEHNETVLVPLGTPLEITPLIVKLIHAIYGKPWPAHTSQDEYFYGLMIDADTHPEFYPSVIPGRHVPQHIIDKKQTKVFMPITYCGTIPVIKSLRKLGAPEKIKVCREAIRLVKNASAEANEGKQRVYSTEDLKFFGRYLDESAMNAGKTRVAICASPKGGVALVHIGGNEHGTSLLRDGFDSMSMLTGGLGETYTYFCYITRELSGARVCRVFQSLNHCDEILVDIGDFALERYMMLKKTKGSVSQYEIDNAVSDQLEVMAEIVEALPTSKAFPGTYRPPPDFVDEEDDIFWRGVMDPTRGATKLHEFSKTGRLPGLPEGYVYHSLRDRLEVVKYKVLLEWYSSNPSASDDILHELVTFADELIEHEIGEHDEFLKSQGINIDRATDEERETGNDEVVDRFTDMMQNSVPGGQKHKNNRSDVVNDAAWSDDEDDLDTSFRALPQGTLAARLEEQSEEVFGFSEDTLQAAGQGFILGNRASSVRRSSKMSARAAAKASIDAEGEWGFVNPEKFAAKAGLKKAKIGDKKSFFIKRGEKGFGFMLRDDSDGVYINKLKNGSPSLATMGKDMTNSKIVTVNGRAVANKGEALAAFKLRPEGCDIEVVVGDPHGAKLTGEATVFIPRGPNGYGVKMAEEGDKVLITGTLPGSTAETTLGKDVNGLQLVKVNGRPVTRKADAITLLKSDARGAHIVVARTGGDTLGKELKLPKSQIKTVVLKRIPSGYGLSFETKSTGVEITKVKPESPAEVAGLLRGMKLLSLNGKDVNSLDKTGMISLIQSSTKTLTVGIDSMERLDRPGIVHRDGPVPTRSPNLSNTKSYFIPRGPKGFGFMLGEKPDGTYIAKLQPGSTSLATLGEECINSKIVSVNGTPVSTKSEAISAFKSRTDGTDLVLMVPQHSVAHVQAQQQKQPSNSRTPSHKSKSKKGSAKSRPGPVFSEQSASTPVSNRPSGIYDTVADTLAGSGASGLTTATSPKAEPVAANAPHLSARNTPRYMCSCSRPEAEQLLTSDGTDGRFLVRKSPRASAGWVASVYAEKRVSHFQIELVPGSPPKYSIKMDTGRVMPHNSIEALMDFYCDPANLGAIFQAQWVPLEVPDEFRQF